MIVSAKLGATMPSKSYEEEPVLGEVLSVDSRVAGATAIRLQLDRVLASPHLCQSKRCQALLKYVRSELQGRCRSPSTAPRNG